MKIEIQKIGRFKPPLTFPEAECVPRKDEPVYFNEELLGYVNVVIHSFATDGTHKVVVRVR